MIEAIWKWLEDNNESIDSLSSILALIVTIIIALIADKVNKKIAWYTGALETHSTLNLRMEAEKNKKEIIWWDPDYRDVPQTQQHGEDAKVDAIRIYLPQNLRLKEKCKKKCLVSWCLGGFKIP